jgi:hypothetical protein
MRQGMNDSRSIVDYVEIFVHMNGRAWRAPYL